MSGVNVDDPSPTPEPVAETIAPAAPVETPPPAPLAVAPDDPDDSAAVDLQGGKYVPLEALRAARSEAKGLKDRASQAENLQAQVQQMQAYIQGLQQQQQRPPEPPPQSPTSDPELVELANSLDYIRADGKPDLERAAKHQAIMQRQAMKIAQQMVGPLQQQTAQERSAGNYQRALATRTPNGLQAKPETLNWMFRELPVGMTSDPRVAQVLPALAIGLDALYGNNPLPANPAPPVNPPAYTEASGGSLRRPTPMTDAERKIIEARGMDEKKYADYTKDWKPGRGTVLEND